MQNIFITKKINKHPRLIFKMFKCPLKNAPPNRQSVLTGAVTPAIHPAEQTPSSQSPNYSNQLLNLISKEFICCSKTLSIFAAKLVYNDTFYSCSSSSSFLPEPAGKTMTDDLLDDLLRPQNKGPCASNTKNDVL